MSTVYRFEQITHDEETGAESRITYEFSPSVETWSGYDGPMHQFFNFLKGCGFLFGVNSEIGVIDKNGEFRGAVDE